MTGAWERWRIEGGGRKGGMDYKWHREALGSHGYVHYIDCGDGFTGIYMLKHQIAHVKYVQIAVCQL